MEIVLPGIKDHILAEGTVVWIKPSKSGTREGFGESCYDMGIKFTDINKSNVEIILSFCYYNLLIKK